MKILIDGKEIKVPEFIANAKDKNKEQFYIFLREALTARAERIRGLEREAMQGVFGKDSIADVFNSFWKMRGNG